jgi:hypothetical protein
MTDIIQWLPALLGIILAVILLVAVLQLAAIRKSLEKLLEQRQMPAMQPRAELASERALWTEAPEQASPERRLEIVSPPPPPAPIQPRFEAASVQAPPAEEIPSQGLPAEVVPDTARPADSPATADLEPPALESPRASRLPTVIGIIVLLGAIAFLAFLVLYTK